MTLNLKCISQLDMMQDRQYLESIKGTCNCSMNPEYAYCLELHTPKRPLIAKLSLYKNYPTNYDYLHYGDVSI